MKNTILIIDDEKPNLIYLNELLSVDYSIFAAKDGQEAIKKANEILPDLILLDIIMPGMNGYEVLSRLKSSEITREIPVIFITGLSSREDEEKGLALGTADYITKPFRDAIVKLRAGNQIRIVNQMRAIERLSMIDPLTEIANRRNFDQRLNTEWRRAIRDKLPISIMIMDVDRFKVYNDTYGHQQGDVALQTVARVLTETLKRPADFAARWGGEEFAILLPATHMDGALMLAERIRENIEGTTITCQDGTTTRVTASIGVNTQMPMISDSLNNFISKADSVLYTAKEMGRNRVCSVQKLTPDSGLTGA